MAEITQNVDSGMTPPTPEAIGMSLFTMGGKAYQPAYIVIPQYDQDTGDEIAPKRVGDLSASIVAMPTHDRYNETYFTNIQNAMFEVAGGANALRQRARRNTGAGGSRG